MFFYFLIFQVGFITGMAAESDPAPSAEFHPPPLCFNDGLLSFQSPDVYRFGNAVPCVPAESTGGAGLQKMLGFLFIFLPPNGMDGSGFGGLHWREFTADDVQSAPPALEHACTAVVSVCVSPCQSREGETALPLHRPTELPRRRHAITIDIAPRADVCHAPKKPTPWKRGAAACAPLSFIMPV